MIDIPNGFIQTRVTNPKDQVIIRMRDVVVDWLVKAAPDVYGPYVTADRKGVKELLVECWNVWFVCDYWQEGCESVASGILIMVRWLLDCCITTSFLIA